jgi:serine/threonine protein kinase
MPGEGTARTFGPTDRIGKYEIIAKIGQGAMGEVYKARDTVLDRFVAIKTMSAAVLGDPDLGQRFLREAQSAARLNHPNVVTLHEFGEDSGRFFMAMELLEGEDLKALLRRGGLPTLDDKLAIMEQILDGVAYAHAAGVIHRDLKPANIHVQANGHVNVMDFGLARFGESDMTRSGTVMGTPNYMSPEQVRGERVAPSSDVFALGAVFYEVIGGRRAFEADSMHAVLYKVTDTEPIPLSESCPDLPAILGIFVAKALAKEPELRYRDGGEMREALELCRRVLDGSVDEVDAVDSLRQARTMIQSPGEDATAARIEPNTLTPTLASPPRGTGQPGSHPALRANAGSLPSVRRGTRSGPTRPTSGSGARAKGPAGRAAVPAAPSRAPLYIGAAAVAAAILAGAVLVVGRLQAPAAVPVDGQTRALVSVAVEAQLDAARRSLEFKDLEGAVAAAGKALRLDPGNSEAADINRRARASLEEVEKFAATAREAAQAGDLDAASKALSRVLALMPKHPVAGELAAQLDSRFKSQADAASREMTGAAEGARRAGASSLRSYAEAANLAGRAESAYRAKQYTEAARQFSEAQRAYEASRRDAQQLAARPTPPPATAPPPPPKVAVVAPTTLAPTPAPTAPPTLAAAPPPSTAAPRPTPNDEGVVRQLVANLGRAIEEKDLALYKRLRPNLSAEDERRLRDAFRNVSSQQVDYRVDAITFEGDKATVRVTRTGSVSGQAVPPVRQLLHLTRSDAGWVIAEIGQ